MAIIVLISQEYVDSVLQVLNPMSKKLPLLALRENDERLLAAFNAAKAAFPNAVAQGIFFCRYQARRIPLYGAYVVQSRLVDNINILRSIEL